MTKLSYIIKQFQIDEEKSFVNILTAHSSCLGRYRIFYVRVSVHASSGGNSIREVGGRSFANFRQICFDFS